MGQPPLRASFADIAEALNDIALWERHRVTLIRDLAMQGRVREDQMELGGWVRRAALIREGASIFTILVPQETAVRTLDPLLTR